MQGERPMQPDRSFNRLISLLCAGPSYAVTRILQNGDDVAGFRVVHAPGHTPGHIILFRDDDRVAIVGDVLTGMNMATAWPGLHEPPGFFCADAAENRLSIRRLAELEPRLLCFGHGPPVSDMKIFDRFLKRLSA
jgi:glyoxylase-like metal-dependent hydrolase (beta-lactamase superfamily II)